MNYPIYVNNITAIASTEQLEPFTQGRQVVIVTDEIVAQHYLPALAQSILAENVASIVLPQGEHTKNLQQFELIISQLIDIGLTRDGLLIALGGGVVGDLTGFAAACYHRGIAYIQIPTTLLAQVDAAIGGKTAINHPKGKNLIGAIYPPKAVFCNVALLATLPMREYCAGLAEVIKYGLILDQDFFVWLEQQCLAILARDYSILLHLVQHCCNLKQNVVAQDAQDLAVRQILNFGHTFAHAIELISEFAYLHGEAVAIGMVAAAKLSERLGHITQAQLERIIDLLKQCQLPVQWPQSISSTQAIAVMRMDKKNRSEGQKLILLEALGKAYVYSLDDVQYLIETIEWCQRIDAR